MYFQVTSLQNIYMYSDFQLVPVVSFNLFALTRVGTTSTTAGWLCGRWIRSQNARVSGSKRARCPSNSAKVGFKEGGGEENPTGPSFERLRSSSEKSGRFIGAYTNHQFQWKHLFLIRIKSHNCKTNIIICIHNILSLWWHNQSRSVTNIIIT